MKKLYHSVMGIRLCWSVILLAALMTLPMLSDAQDLEIIERPVTLDIREQFGYNTLEFRQNPMAEKVGIGLLAVKKNYEQGEDLETDTKIEVSGNKILIQAFAKSEAQGKELLSSLEALGMTGGVVHKHIVNGMLPFDQIENSATISSLRHISMAIMPKMQVGSVTSQGDASMGADIVRATAGVDGSGLKIGILSDAYNTLGGAPGGVASGDLPGPGNPNGYTAPVQILQESFFPGIDEGRAMAELIHDVAPGAELAFHTAFNGFADFANGILELRQAGCDIIVDDVFYFAQPYFQDDIIGQAADAVVQDGAMYFSSAGNSANNSYDEAYNPGGFLFDFGFGLVYEPHDWGNGDYFLELTLDPGDALDFWLQWDEPSLLAGLIGPQKDLDILLFNEDLTSIIDFSLLCNAFEGLPVEFLRGGNGGATPLTVNIFVGRWAPIPGNPSRLKFIDFNGVSVGDRYEYPALVTKSTVVGHPNTEGAIAVGAAAYFNTPAFGVNPAIINGFSSVGGTPILFDPIGNRLSAPIDRLKPDLSATDGANTTFFGTDIEPDGFPNFFGTSASAPHLAALTALLMEAKPYGTNEMVETILKRSALDMNDPRGVHSNLNGTTFDYATGFGFVDGPAALQQVKNIPTMSQWGLMLFLLLITGLSLTTIYSVRTATAMSTGQTVTRPGFKIFFDRTLYLRKLPYGLLAIAVGAIIVRLGWGEILAQDWVGLLLALPLITWILHLMDVVKEDR